MAGVITASLVNAFSSDRASSTQADAAKSAANTQAEANRYAADIQYKMFQEQQRLQEPWRQSGIAAQNRLLTLMGLSPSLSRTTGNAGTSTAGMIANAILSSGAVPGTTNELNVDTSSPDFGTLGKMNPFSFTAADFAKQQDPGYAFRLAEGQKALERSAAARGGLISGGALKAAQRYGQEMGSQEFQNAYTRALTGYNANQQERTALYNRLAGIAGTGQTSTQQIGQAGQTTAANLGNLASATGASSANALLAQGNARASAYGGYGQAIGQGLQGLYNNWGSISNMFGSSGLNDANALIASNPNAAGGQYSVQGNSDYYYDL